MSAAARVRGLGGSSEERNDIQPSQLRNQTGWGGASDDDESFARKFRNDSDDEDDFTSKKVEKQPQLEAPSVARSYIIAAMQVTSLYQFVFLLGGVVLMIV